MGPTKLEAHVEKCLVDFRHCPTKKWNGEVREEVAGKVGWEGIVFPCRVGPLISVCICLCDCLFLLHTRSGTSAYLDPHQETHPIQTKHAFTNRLSFPDSLGGGGTRLAVLSSCGDVCF